MLLVDHHQSQTIESDASFEQLVGADDDVHGTVRETAYDLVLRVSGAKARELFDPYRPIRKPVAERLLVLLRQQSGRDEHRHLPSGLHRDERGTHRDLRLPESDVAAYQAVHRRRPAHVGDDLPDRAGLVRRFLEGEGCLEAVEVLGLHLERDPRPACPACLHLEQFRRHVGDPLRRTPPGSLPLSAAELVQRHGLGIDSRIARNELQRPHRHVELVAVRVVDSEELSARAADRQDFETRVAPDAMRLVHDRRAQSGARSGHEPDPSGSPFPPATPASLGSARTEELRFGDHGHARGVSMHAPSSSSATVIASRASPAMNFAPGLDEYRLQTVRAQGFQQNLSPSRSLRDNEASACMRGEKILKEADRPFRPPVDGQCGWCSGGEPDGRRRARVLAAAAQADAGIGRQPGKQVFDRQEDFARRKYRTLSVVTPVPVPVPGVRPERLGRIVDVLGEDDRSCRAGGSRTEWRSARRTAAG